MRNYWIELREQQQLIASFGGAEIVKNLDGSMEIRGGSQEEKDRAQAWIQRFLCSPQIEQQLAANQG